MTVRELRSARARSALRPVFSAHCRFDAPRFSCGVLLPQGRLRRGAETSLSLTPVGMEHIVLGFDHLAFLLGLLWLVQSPRALTA
jgi:hypothetical protein